MFHRLKFTNFKSWPQADVRFGRITGLFGTNSSGKSSLIQFLLLLKQTKDATDRAISLELNGPYVRLGVYKDMIHRHADSLPLSWALDFSSERELTLLDPTKHRSAAVAKSSQVTASSEVRAQEGGALSTKLEYRFDQLVFSLAPKGNSETDFELTAKGPNFRFIRTQGRPWQLPRPIKSYAFPDQARTYFQNASFLSDIEASYERQMDDLYYLGRVDKVPDPQAC